MLQDLRYAWRSFGASPGFTVAAILSLAIGIGASTAIFSAASALLLRPLPYQNPSRLLALAGGLLGLLFALHSGPPRLPDRSDDLAAARLTLLACSLLSRSVRRPWCIHLIQKLSSSLTTMPPT